MPEHTPVLCPQCGSPLSPQESKCWSCGAEHAREDGLEQVSQAREERREEPSRPRALLARLRARFSRG